MAADHDLMLWTSCTVYLARLDQLRPGHEQWLARPEAARATGFRLRADRDRFVLATAVLRAAVAGRVGDAPARVLVDRGCERCGGQHGRPRLPGTGLAASITHSGDVVAVALTEGCPVGVDVEVIDGRDYEPLLARVCTAAEWPHVRSRAGFLHDLDQEGSRAESHRRGSAHAADQRHGDTPGSAARRGGTRRHPARLHARRRRGRRWIRGRRRGADRGGGDLRHPRRRAAADRRSDWPQPVSRCGRAARLRSS